MTTDDERPGRRIVRFECKRRWYWAWGREWYYSDGELLPFAMTHIGLFTITKDTHEGWGRGWFFHWNRD